MAADTLSRLNIVAKSIEMRFDDGKNMTSSIYLLVSHKTNLPQTYRREIGYDLTSRLIEEVGVKNYV